MQAVRSLERGGGGGVMHYCVLWLEVRSEGAMAELPMAISW